MYARSYLQGVPENMRFLYFIHSLKDLIKFYNSQVLQKHETRKTTWELFINHSSFRNGISPLIKTNIL